MFATFYLKGHSTFALMDFENFDLFFLAKVQGTSAKVGALYLGTIPSLYGGGVSVVGKQRWRSLCKG